MIKIDDSGRQIRLTTDRQRVISAKKVIMAAGFETQMHLRKKLVKLRSTYAMVTQPVKSFQGWEDQCLIWETARPYCYLRTTRDRRILIGGGDDDFVDPRKRDRQIRAKSRQLLGKLQKMFPQIHMTTACAWAGTFGETKDGLPYIGKSREFNNCIFALCYGANGTNFAVIAANLITNFLCRKPNKDAAIFSLDR